MNESSVMTTIPEEVYPSVISEDYVKIEPNLPIYTDYGVQAEGNISIKIEPTSPISDCATDDGTKLEIVYVECVKEEINIDKNDVLEKEICRSMKGETRTGLCHERDICEVDGSGISGRNELIRGIDIVGDVQSGLQSNIESHKNSVNEVCGTGDTKTTLSPQRRHQEIGNACNKRHSKDPINVYKQNKNFTCNVCQKSFLRKSLLSRHMRIHTGERPFTCDVCQTSFSQKPHLSKHMRTHTGEKPFTCNVCQTSFSEKYKLSDHLRIHTGEKPFVCNICQTSFSVKYKLTDHMHIHTEAYSFICNVCQMSFTRPAYLSIHMRIHTGERPFTCNVCQTSFTQKCTLSRHMRTHTGEKPFICNFCQTSFSQSSYLSEHLRVHTGEKPFKCNVCQTSFTQKSVLLRHVRIHK